MKRWLSTLCVLACAAGLFAADEKKADVTAQATGLQVRKPIPSKKKEPVPFADHGSTGLDVTLSAPGKFILGIDIKASKLDHFTDDKDTKLYTPQPFGSWLNEYPFISPEGDLCTVHVNGLTVPAKGATKLRLKAAVVRTCGADEKATDKKEIAIKKDNKETVGAFTILVLNDGAMFGGPQVAVQSDKQNLKAVEFFDPKGEAIKLFLAPYRQTFYPNTPGGKMQYGLVGTLPKKMDAVTVKATYFDKTEAVSAPIDLDVGVGLE